MLQNRERRENIFEHLLVSWLLPLRDNTDGAEIFQTSLMVGAGS
jgi:hypothetical protein